MNGITQSLTLMVLVPLASLSIVTTMPLCCLDYSMPEVVTRSWNIALEKDESEAEDTLCFQRPPFHRNRRVA